MVKTLAKNILGATLFFGACFLENIVVTELHESKGAKIRSDNGNRRNAIYDDNGDGTPDRVIMYYNGADPYGGFGGEPNTRKPTTDEIHWYKAQKN